MPASSKRFFEFRSDGTNLFLMNPDSKFLDFDFITTSVTADTSISGNTLYTLAIPIAPATVNLPDATTLTSGTVVDLWDAQRRISTTNPLTIASTGTISVNSATVFARPGVYVRAVASASGWFIIALDRSNTQTLVSAANAISYNAAQGLNAYLPMTEDTTISLAGGVSNPGIGEVMILMVTPDAADRVLSFDASFRTADGDSMPAIRIAVGAPRALQFVQQGSVMVQLESGSRRGSLDTAAALMVWSDQGSRLVSADMDGDTLAAHTMPAIPDLTRAGEEYTIILDNLDGSVAVTVTFPSTYKVESGSDLGNVLVGPGAVKTVKFVTRDSNAYLVTPTAEEAFTIETNATAVSSNATAVVGETLYVDASGYTGAAPAVTVAPPAGPSAGQFFTVQDIGGNAGTVNIDVDFATAGVNFGALPAQNVGIDVDNARVQFIYINPAVGWIIADSNA
jgi:hypothetical protein